MKIIRVVLYGICCLMLCSITSLSITAAPKTSGMDKEGIEWSYDKKTKTLTFSGTGKTAEFYNEERGVEESTPWWEWHEECKKVVFSDDITEIRDFYLCDFWELQEVKLPKELREIGDGAFESCKSLKKIDFPEKLEKIGEDAFAVCNLKELNLPKSVKEIGDYAFTSNNLRKVEWSDSISYGKCVYSENNKVSKMTFAEGMNELPDGYMFGIHKIKKATFPKNITKISESAFGYAKVNEVALPSSVRSVEKWAFSCAKIGKLVLNEGLEHIGEEAFSGAEIDEIIIPDTVKSFGNDVFSFCKTKKIVLPQEIKKIPSGMFADCEKLESIVIPKGVTELNINAFQRCRMLKTMTIQSEKITKILGNEWDQNPVLRDDITIYVPEKCYEAYKKMFAQVVMPKECRIMPIEGESTISDKSSSITGLWIVLGTSVILIFVLVIVSKRRKTGE